jgi:hypothetical protein
MARRQVSKRASREASLAGEQTGERDTKMPANGHVSCRSRKPLSVICGSRVQIPPRPLSWRCSLRAKCRERIAAAAAETVSST